MHNYNFTFSGQMFFTLDYHNGITSFPVPYFKCAPNRIWDILNSMLNEICDDIRYKLTSKRGRCAFLSLIDPVKILFKSFRQCNECTRRICCSVHKTASWNDEARTRGVIGISKRSALCPYESTSSERTSVFSISPCALGLLSTTRLLLPLSHNTVG